MTKDVLISIRGIQFDNGQDGEKIESIQRGEYYHKNNTSVLTRYHLYVIIVSNETFSHSNTERRSSNDKRKNKGIFSNEQ